MSHEHVDSTRSTRTETFFELGRLLHSATFGDYSEFITWLADMDIKLSRSDELAVWNYAMSHGKVSYVS